MCVCMSIRVCASDRNDESLGCGGLSLFFHQPHKSLYLYCNLCICLEVLSLISLVIISARPLSHHYFFFPSHFMSACIFLCRCFDRQGYCSRGWCLDTGWHCAAPWAHAQIREDIRNPSLHVSFNHTGRRGNVFMDLIVGANILRIWVCTCVS